MRPILLILILSGCATATTTVDRDQAGYTMPGLYTVTVAVVPLSVVRVVCGNETLACAYWSDGKTAYIWLSSDNHAEHEFDHLVFGPKHIKED